MTMKMVIVMRKDLNMRKGKMAAQAAHAAVSMILWVRDYGTRTQQFNQQQWINEGQKKIVVGVDSFEELDTISVKAWTADLRFEMITDRGVTEFHNNPTVTCLAIGPDDEKKIDEITGHLSLL